MKFFYGFSQSGKLEAVISYSKETSVVPDGYHTLIERSDPFESSNIFYDSESNSILFMKEVEENGESIQIIDHDKEPIFL